MALDSGGKLWRYGAMTTGNSKKRVLGYLQAQSTGPNHWFSASAIAKSLGVHNSTVYRALEELIGEGKVVVQRDEHNSKMFRPVTRLEDPEKVPADHKNAPDPYDDGFFGEDESEDYGGGEGAEEREKVATLIYCNDIKTSRDLTQEEILIVMLTDLWLATNNKEEADCVLTVLAMVIRKKKGATK